MPEIPDALVAVVRRHARLLEPTDRLDPAVPLADIGVDSLEMVELIVELEDEFSFEVPEHLLVPEVFVSAASIWAAIETEVS